MILCLGITPTVQRTMTFERLGVDQVNRAESVVESASGKSLNVARVAHALGEAVIASGFIGGDSGAFIREDLARAGIAHDFVTVQAKTRTCITAIDRSGGTATELIQESSEVEKPAWGRLRGRLSELLPRAKVLVLSGSLTPGAPQDFYAFCVKRATECAVSVIVDATGEPLRRALEARPLLVKPNRAELGRTLDCPVETDADVREAIKRMIDRGPAWAVVTMGRDGSVVSNGEQFWRIRAPAIDVVSTIGSGDSYAGGLAAAIARGERLPDACRLGAACAAANAMTPVAGVVRSQDLQRLLQTINIESW
jgi:tagatose 6-phosphate kinase